MKLWRAAHNPQTDTMDPEQRHKRALELADELNNDPLLSADMEMWLTGDTKGRLTGVDIDALRKQIKKLEHDVDAAERSRSDYVNELQDDVERLESDNQTYRLRITELEELLNGKPE